MNRPWENEPDRKDWEAHGFPCVISRDSFFKSLCGYVGVPQGHPWYGKRMQDLREVAVHGGVTFGDPGSPEFFHSTGLWWVGFDCGHLHDLKPYKVGTDYFDPSDVYRDLPYVIREVENLARQAAEAAKEAV